RCHRCVGLVFPFTCRLSKRGTAPSLSPDLPPRCRPKSPRRKCSGSRFGRANLISHQLPHAQRSRLVLSAEAPFRGREPEDRTGCTSPLRRRKTKDHSFFFSGLVPWPPSPAHTPRQRTRCAVPLSVVPGDGLVNSADT
ncbi:unnamed protein product, partial [Scytosiphon promiscuus]